ncbi:MAG: hypothetical protein ACPLKQ_08840 [Candidatus Bathyarchaeales archaeon]
MEAAVFNRPTIEGLKGDLLSYLRSMLDEICEKIAEKYGVYDASGRARKAYVLDTLTQYTCPCCAAKALTQMRHPEVDTIFRECHDLAVTLLIQALRNMSKSCLAVDGEVSCEYGRLDVLVRRLNGGLLQVKAGDKELIVEVKTNTGLRVKQALRYLVERPEATAVIWRVRKRQILVIDGKKHRWLLAIYVAIALHQGLTVLKEDFMVCNHNLTDSSFEPKDPQGFLDDFLTSLAEGLPKIVNAVLQLLGARIENNAKSALVDVQFESGACLKDWAREN